MLAGYVGVADQLSKVGFMFNPFEYLESSADPHLGQYLVEHDEIVDIWRARSSFVSAPSGAGKTALRLFIARLCWERPHSGALPVTYTATPESLAHGPPTLEAHYDRVLQAMSRALFVGILIRPERLLYADVETQRTVVQYLNHLLPARLSYYQQILQTSPSALSLIRRLDPNQLVEEAPPSHQVERLTALLADRLPQIDPYHSDTLKSLEPTARFDHLVSLITERLGFSSIFLLLDDLDGTPETYLQPLIAYEWLAPLLDMMPSWAERGVYLKGFLPTGMQELLAPSVDPVPVTHLQWQPGSLIPLLQRRILAATGGHYGSFDAISPPTLRDVEAKLVARVIDVLPREVLRLASFLLKTVLAKDEPTPRVTTDDLDRGTTRYLQERHVFQVGLPV